MIDKETVKRFHECSFLKSTAQIFINWAVIFFAIWACQVYWSIPLYAFCVVIIASQIHGLAVNLHEGIHCRLSTNRGINNFISTVILALPINSSYKKFKLSHLTHHRHLNTSRDPDWASQTKVREEYPMKLSKLLSMLLFYTFGGRVIMGVFERPGIKAKLKFVYNAFIFVRPTFPSEQSKQDTVIGYIFYAILFSCLIYFGLIKEYFLYWIIPGLTWLQVIVTVRGFAEHYCVENTNKYNGTRNTYTSLFDRVVLGQMWNVGYHLDHHLYPGVPSYNLKKLHTELLKDADYKESAHLTHGYVGVIRECTYK
jgi:fatty acid desaturase